MNNAWIVFFEVYSFSTVIPAATQPVQFINDDFAGSFPLASFQMSSLLLGFEMSSFCVEVGLRAELPGQVDMLGTNQPVSQLQERRFTNIREYLKVLTDHLN